MDYNRDNLSEERMRRGKDRFGGKRSAGVALRYHARSGLSREKARARSYGIDWEAVWRRPKSYQLAERIVLSPPVDDSIGASAAALLAKNGKPERGQVVSDGSALASILYHGYGVTGSRSHKSAFYRLRAAPSAGAVYPVEVYIAVGDLNGVRAGLYHYSPEEFALSLVRSGDARAEVAKALIPATEKIGKYYLIFTSTCWRSMERFGEPAYRYCLLDSGHVIGNFVTLLESMGCRATLRGGFADLALAEFMGINENSEQAIAVLQVGDEGCRPEKSSGGEQEQAVAKGWRQGNPRKGKRSSCSAIHRAGNLEPGQAAELMGEVVSEEWGGQETGECRAKWCVGREILERLEGMDLGEVIAARRTRRRFGQEPIKQEELTSLLAACAVPYRADWLNSAMGGKLMSSFEQAEIYIAANAVEGLEPGLYKWKIGGDGRCLESLGRTVEREELSRICMGQKMAGEAAAVVFIAPRLEGYITRFGDRGYRYAGLHVGVLGERIYLTATALGLGVTGIAGFDDKSANGLCGTDGIDTAVFYAMAFGHPRDVDSAQ
jgi:SagB-type dehydrogenase family enzyme